MQLLGSEVLSSIRTAEGIQSQSQVPINRNNRVHIHSKVQGLPGTFTSTFSFEHHTLQLRGGGKDYKLLFEEKGIEALREQVIIQRSINGEQREKKKSSNANLLLEIAVLYLILFLHFFLVFNNQLPRYSFRLIECFST